MQMITTFEKDEFKLKELFEGISYTTSRRYGKYVNVPVDNIVSSIIDDKNEVSMIVTNGKVVIGYGHLNLFNKYSRRFQATLGLVVHDNFQGIGVGTFILENLIQHATKLKLKKLWVHVHEDNIPSLFIFKKFHFNTEGVFKDDEWFDNKPTTVLSLARFIT
jgi:putative acetyltransferase